MEGVPFLTFQLFSISGPKSNVAIRSSSNSSTLSLMMLKHSGEVLLAGVKTKSLIVLSTSVRPDTVQEKISYITVGSFMQQFTASHMSLGPCQKILL